MDNTKHDSPLPDPANRERRIPPPQEYASAEDAQAASRALADGVEALGEQYPGVHYLLITMAHAEGPPCECGCGQSGTRVCGNALRGNTVDLASLARHFSEETRKDISDGTGLGGLVGQLLKALGGEPVGAPDQGAPAKDVADAIFGRAASAA